MPTEYLQLKWLLSRALQEEELTPEVLLSSILSLYENRQKYISAMEHSAASNAVTTITDMIQEITG